jgi:hypothetical protein
VRSTTEEIRATPRMPVTAQTSAEIQGTAAIASVTTGSTEAATGAAAKATLAATSAGSLLQLQGC